MHNRPISRGRWPAVAWERVDTRVLLSILVAFVLAALWTATALQLRQARQQALTDAGRETRAMARVFDEHAIRTIEAADQAVTYLRGRYNVLGKALDINSDLQRGLNPGPLYNLFSIVDEHGDTVLSSRPFKPTNLADREHIQVHMERDSGELYISKPVLGRVSRKWSIQMTRRINHPDGRFQGVVVVSMDPFYFTRLYDQVDLGNNSAIALVGSDGVIRARRVGDLNTLGEDIGDSRVFALMRGKSRGAFTQPSPVDGVVRLYAFEKLAHYPLYMLVGLDLNTVLAGYAVRRNQAVLMAAITSVLVLLSWAALLLLIGRLIDSRARAIAAGQAKSRFLSNMSHELRTPLVGILGFSELLLEKLQPPDLREQASAIDASGRRLLAIVDAVLELNALEAGTPRLDTAPETVNELLEQAVAPFRARAAEKGLALAWSVAPGVPERIACDRPRLLRLLAIMLDNAVRFTASGAITLHLRIDAAWLEIVVRDTGIGIAEDQQAVIFTRFSQADDSPSRAHGGAGLGLATAVHLAALMGGELAVASAPGQGAVFTVRLPRDTTTLAAESLSN